MAEIARVTVNLPMKVWREVQRMAEDKGISRTEALRRCISTEVFRNGVEKSGGSLLIENADGSRERVTFPY